MTDSIYKQRVNIARNFAMQGKRLIGYFSCHTPVELITASGSIPFRMTGNISEPISVADAYLETIMCPYVRSCLDITLKGEYDFLDGLIIPHTCDNIEKSYSIWKHYFDFDFIHMMNIPHMVHPASFDFMANEIKLCLQKLQEFSGELISEEKLSEAIKIHNKIRSMILDLYRLRQENPPSITGTEAMKIMLLGMSESPYEFQKRLSGLIRAIGRKKKAIPKCPRLLIYGSHIDDIAFIQMVEELGTNIVMDDLSTGSRAYLYPVKEDKSPEMALAQTYLGDLPSPRTFRSGQPIDRFKYLINYAKEYKIDGVILYITRFCDTHEYDVPDVSKVLQDAGYPVLHLEVDYYMKSSEYLRTRVEAFIEMLGRENICLE